MADTSCGREEAGALLSVRLSWSKGHAVMALDGELDLTTIGQVRDAVQEITLRPGRLVQFDLTRLQFSDVAGARALCRAYRQLADLGRRVEVTGTPAQVGRVVALLDGSPAFRLPPPRPRGEPPETVIAARPRAPSVPLPSARAEPGERAPGPGLA